MQMTTSGTNIDIQMSQDELDRLNKSLADLDQKLVTFGQKRCCDCNDGTKFTIEESNDALAILKCLSKCGPHFQMSNHPCDEDNKFMAGGTGKKAKNSTDELKYALRKAGVNLSDDLIGLLLSGHQVSGQQSSVTKGLCSGVKIYDFGNGCGLYVTFNGMISYCCEF